MSTKVRKNVCNKRNHMIYVFQLNETLANIRIWGFLCQSIFSSVNFLLLRVELALLQKPNVPDYTLPWNICHLKVI